MSKVWKTCGLCLATMPEINCIYALITEHIMANRYEGDKPHTEK